MTSLIFGRNSKSSINFVTEYGLKLGFPLHWLNFWTFDGKKLKIVFHSHSIEVEGIFLEKIINLLEEGIGFKLIQISKRYIDNELTQEVVVWSMDYTSNS